MTAAGCCSKRFFVVLMRVRLCGSEVFLVRGTGLELTRRHVTLGRPVSKSTASKTSIEVVRVRQR